MTAQHTPGPWHWESDEVKGDPTGRVRYQVVALGKTVTRVYYSSYEGGQTNAEADARLIAAAPDLLAALVNLLNDTQHAEHPDCEDGPCPVREARAATQKATQGTHKEQV
ncbi:MAG: hypothetical protein Q8S12_11015 [Hydrogenophaga sp.]|uniref:hypothetical protein n=1 Tax=Hydrogenophaga sp. TaxID=1904254 RepID=UPI002734AF23|nr:hypothetical protein [Hydrogenophaga sp.]MDP3627121.1 hypothetical protein [Hydrogenophaga sp.]